MACCWLLSSYGIYNMIISLDNKGCKLPWVVQGHGPPGNGFKFIDLVGKGMWLFPPSSAAPHSGSTSTKGGINCWSFPFIPGFNKINTIELAFLFSHRKQVQVFLEMVCLELWRSVILPYKFLKSYYNMFVIIKKQYHHNKYYCYYYDYYLCYYY